LASLVRAPKAFAKRLGYLAVPVPRFPYVLFVEQRPMATRYASWPWRTRSDALDIGSVPDSGAQPLDGSCAHFSLFRGSLLV
jgi:hypothetical protein